ncbi:hypothetical protein ACVI1L_006200 [Bradyrhizobium sp. USDA 4516]
MTEPTEMTLATAACAAREHGRIGRRQADARASIAGRTQTDQGKEPGRIFAQMNPQHRQNIRQSALSKRGVMTGSTRPAWPPRHVKGGATQALWPQQLAWIGRIVPLKGLRWE